MRSINQFGLADAVVDQAALANSIARFREQGIVLPTFAQLADPSRIDRSLDRRRATRTRPTPATCGGCTGTTTSPATASTCPITSC